MKPFRSACMKGEEIRYTKGAFTDPSEEGGTKLGRTTLYYTNTCTEDTDQPFLFSDVHYIEVSGLPSSTVCVCEPATRTSLKTNCQPLMKSTTML